jgi:hypothetical protein
MRPHWLPLMMFLLTGAGVKAQEQCTAHALTQRYLKGQGLSTDIGKALERPPGASAKGGGPLVVPVVVHVVWNTTAENIPAALIQDMIATLNEDHQGTNSDLTGIRPQFTGVQSAPNISFCLAQVDPNGVPTTGITRTQTTDTWFDPDTETNDMKAAPNGQSPWDPFSYLNIWVCDIASGSGGLVTSGYAYLPVGNMVGSAIDGVVIDYSFGLGPGSRTATHEVGHYLGLQHPWGTNGGCVDDDGLLDTPETDGPTFSCSPTNQTSCGVLTQYENFMDFANCSCMFTAEQSAVMLGTLNGVRSDLLNSPGCGTLPNRPCIPVSLNGTDAGDFIDGVVLGSITNTASGGIGGAAYNDYTTQTTDLVRGQTYAIAITSGSNPQDHVAAWIDHDQDDAFEVDERLGEFSTTGSFETQLLPFTVPITAALGPARLRVRGVYQGTGEPSPTEPCFDYASGETEDYTVNIGIATGLSTGPGNGPLVQFHTDEVVILFPQGASSSGMLHVLDSSGRVLLQHSFQGAGATVDTRDLTPGMHLLVLHVAGMTYTARFPVLR